MLSLKKRVSDCRRAGYRDKSNGLAAESAWESIISLNAEKTAGTMCPSRDDFVRASKRFVETFIDQHLHVDTPVDVPSLGIGVSCGWMRCSITGGRQNAPHWHVGRVAQVICDGCGAFVTELLVLGLCSSAGGVTRDLNHVVLGRHRVRGELVQCFLIIC